MSGAELVEEGKAASEGRVDGPAQDSPAKEAEDEGADGSGAGAGGEVHAADGTSGFQRDDGRRPERVRAVTAQTDLHTVQVVRHLLWHKALSEHDETGERINEYIAMVQGSEEGEHVSIRDGFHRDLAIAFELVIQEHLDPWNLDLSKFAELYLKQAREHGVDLVTAGRIILMAWTVLKLQSDEVAQRAVFAPPEEEEFGWDDMPDFSLTDDAWDFTERVQHLPQAPIDEKIRHKGDRRVTLMELISAFEDVHEEAVQRKKLQQTKLQARLSLKRRMRGRVGGMMHKDDLDAEIAETWHRILDHPAMPIPFSDLIERDVADLVQTFNAVLFLAKGRRIDVAQEDFPYGEIWITPILPEAQAITEEIVEVSA